MRAWYKKRIPLKATVTFNNGERSAEGLVLDFTAPGCLIESPHKVAKGQYLGLQITLPGERSLFTVKLAAVRWTKGNHLGVEFIKMAKIDQHILDAFMAGQTH